MKDLRLISLCNVLYKIITKVLANRLRVDLPKCIFCVLKFKVNSKVREISLKIDISKAYDGVDWSYLKVIMSKIGFDDKWKSWMTLCVVVC